jgi:hypothetical protein
MLLSLTFLPLHHVLLAVVASCRPGFGTTSPGFDTCIEAPIGSYAPGGLVTDPTTQIKPCPIGYTTESAGAHDASQCTCEWFKG